MTRANDSIVIGGGISGLVAAAYLARAGKRVVLLEARDTFGGLGETQTLAEHFRAPLAAQTLYAIDPRVIKDLKLARHGLQFSVRDMALAGLRSDGKHIVIQRDIHATAASIAIHSQQDAVQWPHFRKYLYDLARALRPGWWGGKALPLANSVQRRLAHLSRIGAAAWLDSWFESDMLKATLCFDATAGGLSALEPGSALALVWRAAQEMSGLQGAVAQAKANTLVDALVASARANGAELRSGARVTEVLADGGQVAGVRLETNEVCAASTILCSLSRRRALTELVIPPASGIAQSTLLARSRAPTGQARVILAVRDLPMFGGIAVPPGSRFVLADRIETYIAAELAARVGNLAADLPCEIVIPTMTDASLAPSGQHVVSMLLRPVPRQPKEGWDTLKPKLVAQAVHAYERLSSDLAGRVAGAEVVISDDLDKRCYEEPHTTVAHMLASSTSRIETPLHGLYLCGADAEPVPAVSGRASRIACALVEARS